MIRVLDGKLGDRTFGIVSSGILFIIGLIALLVLIAVKSKLAAGGRALGAPDMLVPLITWVCLAGAALIFYSVFYANTPDQPSYATISKHDA